MGTWSHAPFGNDSAADWAWELEGQTDFSLVAQAIQNVLDTGTDYLEADPAVEAVAAAEVLAKALGRGTQADAYTEAVDTWLKTLTVKPTPELLAQSQAALTRIIAPDSELRELWEESEDFASWEVSIKALQTALVG